VLLSGSGADELLAGYRRYALGSPARLLTLPAWAAAPVFAQWRGGGAGERRFGALVRKAARLSIRDPAERYLESLAVVPARWRARLLGSAEPPPVLERFRAGFAASAAFADGARAADLAVYLPDDVLAKEDRAAAAVSLENRVPFLDDEVADLAGRAPASSLGVRAFRRTKPVLRAALRGVLPGTVLRRRKRGFGVPVSSWLRGPLRAWKLDHLLDPRSLHGTFVDPEAVRELVARHESGDDDLGPAVWALVVLESWMRRSAAS
jgi:asparagine synthase (glutamine-hydrolysing)